jgi:hypothetical protein
LLQFFLPPIFFAPNVFAPIFFAANFSRGYSAKEWRRHEPICKLYSQQFQAFDCFTGDALTVVRINLIFVTYHYT